MSNTFLTISAAVGMQSGLSIVPNKLADLTVVTGLFDRISVSKGGTAEIGGLWASERTALIEEVTTQIFTFQTVNHRPIIDGVIDPYGGTLKLMNQLAADPIPMPGGGIIATVVPAPGGSTETFSSQVLVADVGTMPGTGQLRPAWVPSSYCRRLIRIDGSSIKWFGVVIPGSGAGDTFGTVPHINFTPTPIQGNYYDSTYESFGGWGQLWADYTSIIGGQMAASGADQVLVIPFYQTSQSGKLGNHFLNNWQEVVASVLTAAINSVDPFRLRDTFTFDRIVSSSFSNGWVTHQHFNTQAFEAAARTDQLFDLDGVSAIPSSKDWRTPVGYLNLPPTAWGNPVGGMRWYVGGRWNNFAPLYGGSFLTHAFCRNHLLYHGLWQYCTP
jgi:hypothetical protein